MLEKASAAVNAGERTSREWRRTPPAAVVRKLRASRGERQGSSLARAQGGDAEGGALDVDGDAGEPGEGQAAERGAGRHRHERAAVVADPMQPAVADLKGEKHSTRPQHAVKLLESVVLLLARAQVMQYQHGQNGRKRMVRKGQSRRIPAH